MVSTFERNKIYNLFGRTEFGDYVFNSIADFAAAITTRYNLYQPAPGYTINDVAAQWTYSQYSPFIQDTWQVNDNLSIQYGLRIDIPDANKKPIYNAAFEQAFGYPNNNTLGFEQQGHRAALLVQLPLRHRAQDPVARRHGPVPDLPADGLDDQPVPEQRHDRVDVRVVRPVRPRRSALIRSTRTFRRGRRARRRWTWSTPSRRTSSCRRCGR